MTEGIVVHGDARGRTIGYPTANLAPLTVSIYRLRESTSLMSK